PWEDPPRVDGVVQVRDGWRWVERGTVGVQVPVEWVDESLTCGGAWDGGPPAVASVGTHDYAVSADCMVPPGRDPLVADPVTDEAFPPYPPEMWRTILIIEDEATVYEGGDSAVQVPDGTYTYDGWTLRRVTHGGTRVSLLSDTAHEDVALEVLGSLVVGDVTPAGCRATEEFGQERDQALPPDRAVLAATVCGYEPILQNLGAPPVHRLEVSRSLDEGEAAALLSALRVAPALPAVPDPCAHRDAVSYVQLLRFFVDGAVSESEVAVYDCAVEVDGTWRVLTDEVASHLAGRITW
ncbi:MAG TPA: hypothetical protein VGE77_03315, partial [Nocardioides sp.]